LEDLSVLCGLWKEAQLPVAQLEKRFTEFQVVFGRDGQFVGAIGLHMLNHQGLIHSEAFSHPEVEDKARPFVWTRLQTLAANHGLHRLWTREESPFWTHYAGMKTAVEEELKSLPADFGLEQGRWLTLRLREEHPATAAVEQELLLLKQAKEESLERIQRQTIFWKRLATVVAVLFFMSVLLGCLYLFKTRRIGLPR
jgi:hypothetical protein